MRIRTVGVIVPVFNEILYTKKFIDSFVKQEFKGVTKVLIIIDNASTDTTWEELKNYKSSLENNYIITVLHNDENIGFGPACNQGMKYLDENYVLEGILISNNDIELENDCLENLITCSHLHSSYGIIGGKLFFPDGSLQHCGAFLGAYGWGVHKGGGAGAGMEYLFNTSEEEEYVTGALFYIKIEVYRKIGGFDERFKPAYFEEVDYSYMARKEGWKTIYCPSAKAVHYENITGRAIYSDVQKLKKELSDKNEIKFYQKRYEEYKNKSNNVNVSLPPLPKILLNGKIYGDWSFSGVLRNLAKGLKRNGVDVSIAPEEYHQPSGMPDWEIKEMILKPNDYWNRYTLRSCEGDHMYLLPPGIKRIAHTTGESNIANPMWVEQLNATDQVLTTSSFFKDVLLNSGVKVPIEILHNSVDVEKFNLKITPYKIDNLRGFNFFSSFHFGERKGVDILLKAFIEEFGVNDDVTLTLQSPGITYILQQQGKSLESWANEITRGKNHAPIVVLSDAIHENVLPQVFKAYDCMILPSRSEGFGLPPLEAAALGIPSIVTGYSGLKDVVTPETGWYIDYDLVDIPLQILPYYQNYIGGKWAEPKIEHLRHLMRYVVEHPEEVKVKGGAAFERAQEFSIDRIGKKAKQLIFN